MSNIKKIPDAELDIMLLIWDANGAVTTNYIMDRIDKNWRKQTGLKLLSRLCERGFLLLTKDERYNVYTVLVSKKDYVEKVTSDLLQILYCNSIVELVKTLYDSQVVSKTDLKNLKQFIEQLKNEV